MGHPMIMKFTYLTIKTTGATSSLSLWQDGVPGPWHLSQAEHERPSFAMGVKGRSLGDTEAWDLARPLAQMAPFIQLTLQTSWHNMKLPEPFRAS